MQRAKHFVFELHWQCCTAWARQLHQSLNRNGSFNYSVISIIGSLVKKGTFNPYFQSLMPCPFTGHKMFCASPNILCQTKNRTVFSATPKIFVLALKLNLLNANHLLVWDYKFGTAEICKSVFGMAQKMRLIYLRGSTPGKPARPGFCGIECLGTRKRTRYNLTCAP